ncbi:hypothetical protein SFRURICE_020325 [Spodoptera frugiperda]|uniref:SFRICE_004067 n=1 Tax=Spodoptera frugiperda TaxID=7108 RepID=A0A2H1VQJ1_SPOFR|nr:hypothetical protein SFRURICE_020325 [Spodoptera frugiperda]
MSDVILITTHGRGPADDSGDGDKRATSHTRRIQRTKLTTRSHCAPHSHPSTFAHALVVVPASVSRAPAAPRPVLCWGSVRTLTIK